MPQIKITVLRVFTPEDVFGKELVTPAGKIVKPCYLKEGQEFVSEGFRMPEGFCEWAWQDFRKDLYLLYFGGDLPDTPKGVVYQVCSDGKRPVCFKLERLEK